MNNGTNERTNERAKQRTIRIDPRSNNNKPMSGNDGLTEVLEKTKLVWDGTRNVVDAAPELSCHGKATKRGEGRPSKVRG